MQAVLTGLSEVQQTQLQTEYWRADPIAHPEGAVQVLREASPARPERAVIEQTVAQVFGVDGSELRRATRGRAPVARARQVAMYLAHVGCGMTLTEVGRTFARDRTTVSHACVVIEDGRDDPTFDRVLELLEQVVNALLGARRSPWNPQSDWLVQ